MPSAPVVTGTAASIAVAICRMRLLIVGWPVSWDARLTSY
ncbi:hypothetical protein X948_5316 [Burkholderia pseudomallei MSHR5608]|nr:hypothetical protein X948_5316 [Burkholderia pseudomallei MSHR5608]